MRLRNVRGASDIIDKSVYVIKNPEEYKSAWQIILSVSNNPKLKRLWQNLDVTRLKELKVKESDRIHSVASQLNKMGADIKETDDGFIINGPTKLKGATVESFDDHRIAMMLSIAGLIAEGETEILNSDCVKISFANFYEVLKKVCK